MYEGYMEGASVVAKAAGRQMQKGAEGAIVELGLIDSELYLYVRLLNGTVIGPSLADYWEIVKA